MNEISDPKIESYTYRVPQQFEFLTFFPEAVKNSTLAVVSLHGYGQNPTDMLRLAAAAVGPGRVLVGMRGPNQFYLQDPTKEVGPNKVGYNWGTSQHWQEAVEMHHSMVETVLELLRQRTGIGPERTVLLGFSQPVGLNYRLVASRQGLVRGVIGVCGGLPRDWEEPKYGTVDAAILHIAREEDPFYPVDKARQFADRLRTRAADVEFHLLPGGHRFPSNAANFVRPWLERVFCANSLK